MTHAQTRARIVEQLRAHPWRNPFAPNSWRKDPEIDRSNEQCIFWSIEAGHFNNYFPDERITPEEVTVATPDRDPVDVESLPKLRGLNRPGVT